MISVKYFLKIALLATFFFSLSCKKDTPKIPAQYIGNWVNSNVVLEIESDGTGRYENFNDLIPISGRVQIKSNLLIIKNGFMKKELTIDKPPYEDDMGAEFGYVTGVMIDKIIIDGDILTNDKF
jgi:hypothetical protein